MDQVQGLLDMPEQQGHLMVPATTTTATTTATTTTSTTAPPTRKSRRRKRTAAKATAIVKWHNLMRSSVTGGNGPMHPRP